MTPAPTSQLQQAISALRQNQIEQAEAILFNIIHRTAPETPAWTAALFAVNWLSPCNKPEMALEVLTRAIK